MQPYAPPAIEPVNAQAKAKSRRLLWWGLGAGCGCIGLILAFVLFLAVWQFFSPVPQASPPPPPRLLPLIR